MQKCLNSSGLLGKITHIRCLQLQFNEQLTTSPLEKWSVPFRDCSRSLYVTLFLSLLNNSSLSFTSNFTNNITEGSFSITDILNLTDYQRRRCIKNLTDRELYFLSQMASSDGSYLLSWRDLNSHPRFTKCNKSPKWFISLESIVLQLPSASRRFLPTYQCDPNSMLKSLLNQLNMLRLKSYEWIATHMNNSQTYFEHIVFKSACIDLIIVEHWIPFISHISITPDSNSPVLQQCFGYDWN